MDLNDAEIDGLILDRLTRDGFLLKAWKGGTQEALRYVFRAAWEAATPATAERCAKACEARAQDIANDHTQTEYDTGATVWENEVWQAMCEEAEDCAALCRKAGER